MVIAGIGRGIFGSVRNGSDQVFIIRIGGRGKPMLILVMIGILTVTLMIKGTSLIRFDLSYCGHLRQFCFFASQKVVAMSTNQLYNCKGNVRSKASRQTDLRHRLPFRRFGADPHRRKTGKVILAYCSMRLQPVLWRIWSKQGCLACPWRLARIPVCFEKLYNTNIERKGTILWKF